MEQRDVCLWLHSGRNISNLADVFIQSHLQRSCTCILYIGFPPPPGIEHTTVPLQTPCSTNWVIQDQVIACGNQLVTNGLTERGEMREERTHTPLGTDRSSVHHSHTIRLTMCCWLSCCIIRLATQIAHYSPYVVCYFWPAPYEPRLVELHYK